MDKQYYERISDDFKAHHPYLANNIAEWYPRGEMGIRVVMTNGTKYDFHSMSKSIRDVKTRPVHFDNEYDEDEWRDVFADRLAEYIATKGLTQQALSEYTGISKGAINKYIQKAATPSAYVLTKLARALDCTIMDLTD